MHQVVNSVDQTIDWAAILSAVSSWILAIVLIVKGTVESRNKRLELKAAVDLKTKEAVAVSNIKTQAGKIEYQRKDDMTAHEMLLSNQKEDRADKRIYEQQLVNTTAANVIYSQHLKEAIDTISGLKVAQAHLEDTQKAGEVMIDGLQKNIAEATTSYSLLSDSYQLLLTKFSELQTKFDAVSAANTTLQAALIESSTKITAMQTQIDTLIGTIQKSVPKNSGGSL